MAWAQPALHGVPVASVVLALYVRWFAVADRYIVFLYYHDMGPRVPDTSPFSRVTSSRYWMAGLVGAGAALAFYSAASWAAERLVAGYVVPSWWRVWLLAGITLLIGIPVITMTFGEPVLPLLEAVQTTVAAIAGTAIACASGELAARRPRESVGLALDGLGIMVVLLGGSLIYYPLKRVGLSHDDALRLLPFAGLLAATVWLAVVTLVRGWLRTPPSSGRALLTSGLAYAYLLMPLLHHIAFTDGYFYITNSDNFFYPPWWRQLGAWLMAIGLAVGARNVRERLHLAPAFG